MEIAKTRKYRIQTTQNEKSVQAVQMSIKIGSVNIQEIVNTVSQ